jgi:hypothetical protein
MEFLIGLIILIALSYMAYWRGNPVFFMLVAGASIIIGLYTPDALGSLGYSTFGVSIGLMLIGYSFVNIGLAFGSLFRGPSDEEEEQN